MFRFDREKYENSGAYVECQQRYGKSLIEYLTIVSQAHHSQVKYLEKAKNNLFRGKFLSKCEFEDLAAWRPPFWTEESVRRSPVVSQQSPTVEQLGDTGSPAVQPEEGASHSRPVTPDIESDRDEADENEEEEENSSDDSGGSNDESSSSDDSDSESDEQPPPPTTTTKTKTTEAPPAQVESSDKDVTGGKRADPQQQPDTTNDEAEESAQVPVIVSQSKSSDAAESYIPSVRKRTMPALPDYRKGQAVKLRKCQKAAIDEKALRKLIKRDYKYVENMNESGELRYLAIPMAPSSGKELSRMPSVDFKNLMARWHERDTTIGEETRELVSKWERNVLAILVMRAKKAAEARHAREEEKQLLQRLKSHKSKSFLAKVDKVLKKQ